MMAPGIQSRRCRRRAFTLLEIVLVMAVLLIAAALALPAIDAMMAGPKLAAARDMVRARWAETRGRAMEEGRAYRFAVTENTGKFRIAPDDDVYWSGGAAEGVSPDDKPYIVEGELPDDVLFTTSALAFQGTTAAPGAGPDWGLAVAIFLPTGAARDDAELYFGKAGERVLGLRLRGLTGAVTAIDVTDANSGGGQP
jgi:prepilin-type N-terminal cleavage/methylation domain-containing protein